MGELYNSQPFELTPHVVYALQKLLAAHDDWGYSNSEIMFEPYGDGFKPSRTADENISILMQYLHYNKLVKIIPLEEELSDKEFPTPIINAPKIPVQTKWRLKVLQQDKIRNLYRQTEMRVRTFNELDLKCDLYVQDNYLFLKVGKKSYELKKFNGRGAQTVFQRLSLFRYVERDSEGYIKGEGIGAGIKIGALNDVVRNAGFSKKSRKYLFDICKPSKIELKSSLFLDGEEVNFICEDFVRYAARRKTVKLG